MPDFDLIVTSGVGPAEARRFVFQLAARLERVAEARGLLVKEVVLHGDAESPRSAVIQLAGDVLGALVDELGTHVLIQRSARRSRASRKRWFAAVALHEHVAVPAGVVEIPRDDIVVTACRAGGPGGQHVNKVSSAVRVQHVPTGLVIRCGASRSQHANLDHALRRLGALLREREETRRADAGDARRTSHYRLERGRPIRTYQLDADGVLEERIP